MSLFRSSYGSSSSRRVQQTFDSLLFSQELIQNSNAFRLSTLNDGNPSCLLGFDGEVSCVAFDPLQSLLGVATKSGRIAIYGHEKVPKCSWQLRPSQAVKHLVLKAGTSCVLVLDAKETLHVFDLADLDERGEPTRLLAHSMRAAVNCIEYAPQLSHIFLGCQDGTVDTFDVDRISTSPYRIKNLWLEQDDLLRRSGVHNAPSRKRIPACTDIKTHPLDPNQLLIAYEGGIALYDLTEQALLRVYEYLVLPGAPGGHNDQSESAFLERRPACTCLAWRPDGKIFAAGYDDGSIVFWSIEDGDRNILAKTLSMDDVNLATSSSLFGDNAAALSESQQEFREPVFKLAWSGFGDGKPGTVLSVLGGLMPEDQKGLHCLHLPAFAAPSMLGSTTAQQAREALRASVTANYKTLIPSDTPPEDFTLLTSNPYYAQSNDPFAVVLLLSPDQDLPKTSPHTERGFAAYAFPPAPLRDQKELALPMELQITGSQSVLLAEAVSLPIAAYQRLQPEQKLLDYLPLQGGETTFGKLPAPNNPQRRHQTNHAILSIHLDMSVRIWDSSNSFPELLNTFSAREPLSDEQLESYLEGKTWIDKVSAAWEVTEIAFGLSTGDVMLYKFAYARPSAVIEQQQEEEEKAAASEQLVQASEHGQPHLPQAAYQNPLDRASTSRLDVEMAAAASSMSTNDAPTRSGFFGRKKAAPPTKAVPQSRNSAPTSRSFEVDLVDTSRYSDWTKDGYKPVFTLSVPQISRDRSVTALALSEAGFLAAAWGDKLAVVDLRGPEVLFSEAERVDPDEKIVNLVWTVCAEGDDPERHPRLIVSYTSGLVRILTLSYVLDTWIVNTSAMTFQQSSFTQPIATLLLDPFGNSLHLTTSSLDDCLRRQESSSSSSEQGPTDRGALNTLLIMVSETSLTVKANLTGEKLLNRGFGNARAVAARVVRRYGMPVLVVVLHDGSCVVFSLPKCEEIKAMQLNFERSRASLSPDGRIFQSLSPTLFQYSTLFADQAPTPLKTKYHNTECVLPPAPTASYMAAATSAAASYVSSWFGGSAKTATTATLDDILGGPKRPQPRIKSIAVSQDASVGVGTSPAAGSGSYPARPARTRPVAPPRTGSQLGATKSAVAEEEVTYNKFGMPIKKPPRDPRPGRELTDALEERGERLSYLNEHLDNAQKASLDFVAQAKRMAAVQGGKAAVSGVGKGISAGIGKMLS